MKQVLEFITKYRLGMILIAYFITRLTFLTRLPIFTDESIYIFWAKVIATSHSQWFISLTDGKPPLLIWMIAAFLSILPQEAYLIAGRLPSVFAGMMSVIALWLLSGLLFKSKKIQVIATVLYIIHPFLLMYDRMALFDSMLSAAILWSVYFAVRTAKTLSYTDALLWGLSLGIAFLSKPTALIFLFLTPCIALLYAANIHKKYPLQRLIILSTAAVIIGEIINNLQRLSRVYYLAGLKNSQFQLPLSELLRDPFQLTAGNMRGFLNWMIDYSTHPFFILVVLGFVVLLLYRWRIGVILLLLWLAPVVALATIGREIFPRYILFTTPYAILSAAFLLAESGGLRIKNVPILSIVLCIFCIPMFLFSTKILTNPENAPLPPTDYRQYVSEHPSGYGLEKVFNFLNNKSMTHPVTVVTQGTFGLYPYAFTLEYWGNPKVTVMSRWPLDKLDEEIYEVQKTREVYVVLKEQDAVPATLPVTTVLKAEKPGGRYPIFVTIPR